KYLPRIKGTRGSGSKSMTTKSVGKWNTPTLTKTSLAIPIGLETERSISSRVMQVGFFPPSKTTNLRNEITRFQQRFDESFYEAWDCFNDLLRACPHHGFSELHQLDTFYNALNVNDQDSLNSTAGGNFLDKMPHECLKVIESKSKVCQSRAKAVVAKVSTSSSTSVISSDIAELKDMVRALLLEKKNQSLAPSPTPAPVKAFDYQPSELLVDLREDLPEIDLLEMGVQYEEFSEKQALKINLGPYNSCACLDYYLDPSFSSKLVGFPAWHFMEVVEMEMGLYPLDF
nr:reverse transcriptase domain-containing protein [Tanacetum cinerariifolium]